MHIDDMRLPFRLKIQTSDFKGGPGQFENFLSYELDLQVIRVKKLVDHLEADVYIYDKEESDTIMKWFWKDEAATYEKSPSNDFFLMLSIQNSDTESVLQNCNPNFKQTKKAGRI